MSSYLVQDRTICDPLVFLSKLSNSAESWILRPLEKLGYDLSNIEDRERLAKDLFVLNIDGVEARYGKGQAKEFRPLDFKFVDSPSASKRMTIIQCVKSLHCLIYQCSEGNVPERELYKAMEEVIHNLEAYIVHSLHLYSVAEWA